MLVPRTLSVATTSAAMGKQHTLGITLSDSSGPLGLASSSPQFCIVLLVALARGMKLPTVLEGGIFLGESEVRALRAQGAEDPSSMLIERSMRERDVTGQPLKELPKIRAKPARMEKVWRASVPGAIGPCIGSKTMAHCCEYDWTMFKAQPTLTRKSVYQHIAEI
jgi:hypothetical protein